MVHQGFVPLDGRMVLVRTDDLTPKERADISEFFALVRRTQGLEHFAVTAGLIAGILSAIFMLCLGLLHGEDVVGEVGFLRFVVGFGGIVGAGFWFGGIPGGRIRQAKVQREIEAITRRSERCRVVVEQLCQIHAPYATLLSVPVPAPSTAGHGVDLAM